MAVDDSSNRVRLIPCLTILRYTVATVVTVLAVVVIVMVIAVGVRPADDVSVSVVLGQVGIVDCFRRLPGATYPEFVSCSGFGGRDFSTMTNSRPPTPTGYTRLDGLSLEVILSVDNRSGRGIISCRSINVSFYAGTPAGMEIGRLNLKSDFDFHLEPQTSHKIYRIRMIDNRPVLEYIFDNYGGNSSFTGTVEVAMNTSSVVLRHHTTSSIVKFVCSPVDFSVEDATATATSVQCTKIN